MSAVTERALVARINRKLAHEGERLSRAKRHGEVFYWVEDTAQEWLCARVLPEALGRELGVLQPGEKVLKGSGPVAVMPPFARLVNNNPAPNESGIE